LKGGRNPGPEFDLLLTPKQAGTRMAISARHVLRLPIRQVRLGPRTIRYRKEDIDAFIEKSTTAN